MRTQTKFKQKEKVLRSNFEKVIFAIIFIMLALYALSMIYPIFWLINNTFKGGEEYLDNKIALAKEFFSAKNPFITFFSNYPEALKRIQYKGVGYIAMFINSLWFSVGVAGVMVFFSSLVAYVISKYNFVGKNVIFWIAVVQMIIPIVGNLPAAAKLYNQLGIVDSPLLLISFCGGLGAYFFIMYATFNNISWSYAESAMIDGANDYLIFFKVMMPQAASMAMTLFILQFIVIWNDYMTPLLFLKKMPTLSTGLYLFEGNVNALEWPIYYAGLIMLVLPVLAIFIAFNEKIMSSITMGSLKG